MIDGRPRLSGDAMLTNGKGGISGAEEVEGGGDAMKMTHTAANGRCGHFQFFMSWV